MDVFRLRNTLVNDYKDFVTSFVSPRDERIGQALDDELERGLLWPAPLIQLNPSFARGGTIEKLVSDGVLHAECARAFRIGKERDTDGIPLSLHQHQVDSIRTARQDLPYVVTTGTGSGKSLCYIIPIVDFILRAGAGEGIRAIIVYPMNALANSQFTELEKFLCHGYPDKRGPVTFARYTGQESEEQRQAILAEPPDILLTNYVMLELILTRPDERQLIASAGDLKFLVLDELHTYRGRQGADVAMLVRRICNRTGAKRVQYVGTSATMASTGSYESQRRQIADVATRIFGSEVKAENVIGETLERATAERNEEGPEFVRELKASLNGSPPSDVSSFCRDPLAIWIESRFGLERDTTDGRLKRAKPRPIFGDTGVASELATLTGLDEGTCADRIQRMLLAGYSVENPRTGFPVFAFRLHQFVSRGDTIYSSPESENDRHVTFYGQQFVPGQDRKRVLLPLAFCRECGQDYYVVRKSWDSDAKSDRFLPRELMDILDDGESQPGFLYISSESPWPENAEAQLAKIPEDWIEDFKGKLRVKRNYRNALPKPVTVNSLGVTDAAGVSATYLAAPFRFCLRCSVSYSARMRSDFAKLVNLGTGGRSTATTILSLATIRGLQDEDLRQEAKKLLSFTDNRQDASLQAGHFNDFLEVGILRAALYAAAVASGENGLRHDELTQKVFDALNLALDQYAVDPTVRFNALEDTKAAFRDILGYRLYHDLRRGWRVNAPNLEQCGLLEMRYLSLGDVSRAEDVWETLHPALATAKPETREKISKVLLDYMRQNLAIKVDYLTSSYQDRIRQRSSQRLNPPWAIDEGEKLEDAKVLYPRSVSRGDYQGHVYLSSLSGFGQYLRKTRTFPEHEGQRSVDDCQKIIIDLLSALRLAGLVEVVDEPSSDDDVSGYQIPAAALIWLAGDGTKAYRDPLRMTTLSEADVKPNPFFLDFYRSIAMSTVGVRAAEHTAQVPNEERQKREALFGDAKLPLLFCSPTMELGVDIKQLNVVNMRNIPPTPANYAQRSGRAGRSGQPALVYSYCATGSSHDQYFFRRPELMVYGAVTPPRIDLTNKDLLESHVQAIWLTETGQSLGRSLKDLLVLEGDSPSMELLQVVRDSIDRAEVRSRAKARARAVLETIEYELKQTDWYSDTWLDEVLNQVVIRFEKSCERWRGLYRAALDQFKRQNAIISDASRSMKEKEQAKRLRAEAETQMNLLTQSNNLYQSDFYSYRYFASEGFLPGYNFPRLPLSAFIPARRTRDEFLSRPRFLAISEFGPRAFIYHEGSRYIINKVILPVDESENIVTRRIKICPACGYLHVLSDSYDPDTCEGLECGQPLEQSMANLFRLENVSTKRRDRINCDEEERLRLGYELKTTVRFAKYDHRLSYRRANVESDNEPIASLAYGDRANIWRINMGWNRRKDKNVLGFLLDVERGYWRRNEQLEDDDDDPTSANIERVVPFVEDYRNCLIWSFARPLDIGVHASLQSALKHAIQVRYQLEEMEIATEPLPSKDIRSQILFYEASEGGAGVLRHLIDDPQAVSEVAREALHICHFDPDSGEDLKRAKHAYEECEAACYDCLMSYSNQMDHELLDRKAIVDILLKLASAKVTAAPTHLPRGNHLEQLRNLCQSNLERDWLAHLDRANLRLPSRAQMLVERCGTRPDFAYEDAFAAIYVDGPHHDFPERQERDKLQTDAMEDLGWTVIRFGYQADWDATIDRYPHIFGRGSE